MSFVQAACFFLAPYYHISVSPQHPFWVRGARATSIDCAARRSALTVITIAIRKLLFECLCLLVSSLSGVTSSRRGVSYVTLKIHPNMSPSDIYNSVLTYTCLVPFFVSAWPSSWKQRNVLQIIYYFNEFSVYKWMYCL